MAERGGNRFDLEERTFQFAQRVRALVKKLPRTICNVEDVKQLVRASGSVGANYIEANEALSKKDFKFRVRIARKKAKESRHFLRLVDTHDNTALNAERNAIIQESRELVLIFTAILKKSD